MPSLRELFKQVTQFDKRQMSPRLYAVVQALVKAVGAVEPEDTAEPAYIYAPMLNATLRELTQAKATIRNLRKELGTTKAAYAGATERISALRAMLAETRAEIERLREESHDQLTRYNKATETLWQELTPIREDIRQAQADAEIGRLVRGMRVSTRLVRGSLGDYLAMQSIESTSGGGLWVWLPGCSPDPAEALRAIQEVGDAEA